jgi:hypothetical protein
MASSLLILRQQLLMQTEMQPPWNLKEQPADNYYSVGTHTVRVRAKDIAGAYSPWAEKSFTIVNSAPTVTLTATPTRTVKDGKFFVDIKATANDADGDATTLEYEGRTSDNYYSVGTHTVRVRAKDIAGAYSPWVEKELYNSKFSTNSNINSHTNKNC